MLSGKLDADFVDGSECTRWGRWELGRVRWDVVRVRFAWAGARLLVVSCSLLVVACCSFSRVRTRIGLNEQGPADARKIRPQVHKTLDGAQICHATVGLPTR